MDKDKAVSAIPTLRMLTLPYNYIAEKASRLGDMLENINDVRLYIKLLDLSSRAGGGSLPLLDLPSRCVGIKLEGVSANAIERYMRGNMPPVIGRIENDLFIMDLRTIQDNELKFIEAAVSGILREF
jgi:L-seryl-tRNA(Ser) seleniumtransferase